LVLQKHIIAEHEHGTGQDCTLDEDVIEKGAVLSTECSQEALEHASDGTEEHIENPKVVDRRDGLLHVLVVGDRVHGETEVHLQGESLDDGQCEHHGEHGSVVVFGSSDVGTSNLFSRKGGTHGGEGVSEDEHEHGGSKQENSGVLFSDSKPSSDEGKELPLPCVDPEHNQLGDSIVKISSESAACLPLGAETSWLHGGSAVLEASHNEIIGKGSDELSEGKTFGSHLVDGDQLVADKWVDGHEEAVGQGWSPEVVKAVEESSVSIGNTPEPNCWCQVKEIILSALRVFLILSEHGGEDSSPVEDASEHAEEKERPKEQSSIEDVTRKFDFAGGERVRNERLQHGVEDDGCSEADEVNQDVGHRDDVNELVVT